MKNFYPLFKNKIMDIIGSHLGTSEIVWKGGTEKINVYNYEGELYVAITISNKFEREFSTKLLSIEGNSKMIDDKRYWVFPRGRYNDLGKLIDEIKVKPKKRRFEDVEEMEEEEEHIYIIKMDAHDEVRFSKKSYITTSPEKIISYIQKIISKSYPNFTEFDDSLFEDQLYDADEETRQILLSLKDNKGSLFNEKYLKYELQINEDVFIRFMHNKDSSKWIQFNIEEQRQDINEEDIFEIQMNANKDTEIKSSLRINSKSSLEEVINFINKTISKFYTDFTKFDDSLFDGILYDAEQDEDEETKEALLSLKNEKGSLINEKYLRYQLDNFDEANIKFFNKNDSSKYIQFDIREEF